MLDEGHLDLNSVQFCSDSVRERLKQTMLNQELVLKGQIVELHRLYKIQIAMSEESEDIRKRGLGKHNSLAVVNSNPLNLNNQVNCSMSGVQSCIPDLNQKALDLHFSADDFVGQSDKGSSGNKTVRELPIESNNSIKYKVDFDLNRPLSIAEDTDKSGVEHRSWMEKRTFRPPPEIIDLEDPNSIYSNKDANLGRPSSLSTPHSCLKDKPKSERSLLGDKHNLQIVTNYRTGHISPGTSTRPFNDVDLTCQKQSLCKTGFGGNFLAAGASVPRGTFRFDLNTVPTEHQSYISDSHSGVVNPVSTAFSTMTQKSYSVNSCTIIPDIHVQTNVKLGKAQNLIGTNGAKLSRGGRFEANDSKIVFIDLDPDSDDELCGSDSPKIESMGSASKLSNDRSCETDVGEAVAETKPLMLSHVVEAKSMNASNFSYDESQMVDMGGKAAHLEALEQKSSESLGSNIYCINGKEVEVDAAVEKAAELLIQLSLRDLGKLDSKVSKSKEQYTPQWSVESYEAMVLKAKECGPDNYCVSSNTVVVDVAEKKGSRYRRKSCRVQMNNFKDVLSSVPTLSRREIREDLKNFKVIKSNERKKRTTRMVIEGDWCKQTRSKRSRLSRRSYLPS